ncbi:ATP-binding cassette domain-containing protein [Puniceibacterium sediminis]|uniref:Tungstate transport system ATP-binding protein n=1 Tax=Puniceibacterium sediminis TaxID=1608407 RepID=A0A238X071_9RHOB|nr:ATP-binding cassette domain-containing protein [Puniceibacterium sediminis]SNR52073.1 tungstate transport system ATP-binding protein [Puniceibacterium sediminis]
MREVPVPPPVSCQRVLPFPGRAASGPCLSACGLRYEAGGRVLIDGLDLSLGRDGITMVMGPNGAGKSLLLRLLHGLIPPEKGSVFWGDTLLDAEARKRQAMVFQKPVLLRRSVAANVDFVLRPGDPVRCDALLERVGLLARADQPARLLSGGEQQRLALARALATGPNLLFLDEPTASLDPASALMIEDILREERSRGTKIVCVTHDIGQARRLADDVVFLSQGRLVEHRAAAAFFKAPAAPAAQAYLEGRLTL